MASKLARKNLRKRKREAWKERFATRSAYAAKTWERENGKPPNPNAHPRKE